MIYIAALWTVLVAVVVLAVWRLSRVTAYHGRHRVEDVAPVAPREEIAEFIDILTMPLQGCDLPPVAAPAAYAELGPTRFMAAQESMRRREKALRLTAALRATRVPTGALVALSEWGTPVRVDGWSDDDDLIGAAT